MTRELILSLAGLAALGLAACASAPAVPPQVKYASSVRAAQATNHPLVIYDLTSASDKPPGIVVYTFVGVGVVNTAQRPIRKLSFRFADYRNHQPVQEADGRPRQTQVTVTGSLVPGMSGIVVSDKPIWATAAGAAKSNSCVRLIGVDVTYQDGSSDVITADEMAQYLIPQLDAGCMTRYSIPQQPKSGEWMSPHAWLSWKTRPQYPSPWE